MRHYLVEGVYVARDGRYRGTASNSNASFSHDGIGCGRVGNMVTGKEQRYPRGWNPEAEFHRFHSTVTLLCFLLEE